MEQAKDNGMASGEKIFSTNTEFHRFGIYAGILLIIGCTGGLAVGLGAVNSIITLIAIVVPTMATLALLLALAPMKILMKVAAAATIINTLFIAYYLIA